MIATSESLIARDSRRRALVAQIGEQDLRPEDASSFSRRSIALALGSTITFESTTLNAVTEHRADGSVRLVGGRRVGADAMQSLFAEPNRRGDGDV